MTTGLKLGLLGSGIAQSMSPAFNVLAGINLGIDVSYELLETVPEAAGRIGSIIEACHEQGYHGLNVTYPFKQVAFESVIVSDPLVRRIGAVNTIVFEPRGATMGYNTDHSGLLRRWQHRFADAVPGTVALIGAGGVGRAAAFAMGELGAAGLRVVDSDQARSEELSATLHRYFPDLPGTSVDSAEEAVRGVDGVINATSVGMYFNPGSPVDLGLIGEQKWLFDAVYTPIDTALVRRARETGLRVLNGFELFLGQAIDAFELFSGRLFQTEITDQVETTMWRQVTARPPIKSRG